MIFSNNTYIKERFAMVYLVTGPRGSGKTQQMIDLANEKVKTSNGNVVFIKKSQKILTRLTSISV